MNPLNSMVPLCFLLVVFALISPSKPDAALILSTCQKTHRPVYCTDCLRSAPGSHTADARGLALLAIECAARDTKAMVRNLGVLIRATPTSPLQFILEDCWTSAGIAIGNFAGIRSAVKGGDYATGRNGVDITIRNVDSCMAGFRKNPNIPVPFDVSTWSEAADQSWRIVSDILNNFETNSKL